jgi:hypothetical protein
VNEPGIISSNPYYLPLYLRKKAWIFSAKSLAARLFLANLWTILELAACKRMELI